MYFDQDLAHGYQVNRLDDLNLSDCLKQVGPTLLNCKYYYIIFELCFLGIYEICRKLEKCWSLLCGSRILDHRILSNIKIAYWVYMFSLTTATNYRCLPSLTIYVNKFITRVLQYFWSKYENKLEGKTVSRERADVLSVWEKSHEKDCRSIYLSDEKILSLHVSQFADRITDHWPTFVIDVVIRDHIEALTRVKLSTELRALWNQETY